MSELNLPSDLKKYKFWKSLKDLGYIKNLYLFGSRARGDNFKKSDIDIAIELQESKSCDENWHKIMSIIDNADTLLKIDCINITNKTLEDELINNILSEGVIVFGDKIVERPKTKIRTNQTN